MWGEARLLVARFAARQNGFGRGATRDALLRGLVAGGPLHGLLAHAAALIPERDARLDAALDDLTGIQGLDEVGAVAAWIRNYGRSGSVRARLIALATHAPPEARREVLAQLLPFLGPPDEAKARDVMPFAAEVLRMVGAGDTHPAFREWADYLKERT